MLSSSIITPNEHTKTRIQIPGIEFMLLRCLSNTHIHTHTPRHTHTSTLSHTKTHTWVCVCRVCVSRGVEVILATQRPHWRRDMNRQREFIYGQINTYVCVCVCVCVCVFVCMCVRIKEHIFFITLSE